jgi:acetyl-CoA acetyltransferase
MLCLFYNRCESVNDIFDFILILQAFASQFVYCQKKLDLDPEKINVNGGAMAIGHPLGATGTDVIICCFATFNFISHFLCYVCLIVEHFD